MAPRFQISTQRAMLRNKINQRACFVSILSRTQERRRKKDEMKLKAKRMRIAQQQRERSVPD